MVKLSQSRGSVPAVLVLLCQDMTLCDTLRRGKTSGAAGTCRPRLEASDLGIRKKERKKNPRKLNKNVARIYVCPRGHYSV